MEQWKSDTLKHLEGWDAFCAERDGSAENMQDDDRCCALCSSEANLAEYECSLCERKALCPECWVQCQECEMHLCRECAWSAPELAWDYEGASLDGWLCSDCQDKLVAENVCADCNRWVGSGMLEVCPSCQKRVCQSSYWDEDEGESMDKCALCRAAESEPTTRRSNY